MTGSDQIIDGKGIDPRGIDPKGIDPRAVPTGQVVWSSAMRLRAVRLPSKDALSRLADTKEAYEALEELADITDARKRVLNKEIGHLSLQGQENLSGHYQAIFYNKPEWLFSDGAHPGFVVSKILQAALAHAMDFYGGFLKDCSAGETTMQFIVDRMRLDARLHDLTDMDSFGALYQSDDWSVPQATAKNLMYAGSQGFTFGVEEDLNAVILDTSIIQDVQAERAVALKWDGNRFTRLFDYRDLYWKDLA